MEDLITLLIGVAVSASGLLLALIFTRGDKTPADKWLKLWFIVIASSSLLVFVTNHTEGGLKFAIATARYTLFSLSFPCLYLYARNIVGKKVQYPWAYFSLGLINVPIDAWMYSSDMLYFEGDYMMVTDAATIITYAMVFILTGLYIWLTFAARQLTLQRLTAANHPADRKDLRWIKNWANATIALQTFNLLMFLSQTAITIPPALYAILWLLSLCSLILYVGYTGLKNTRYFRTGTLSPEPLAAGPTPSQDDISAFDDALTQSEAYLEPDLTLEQLSRAIQWPEDRIHTVLTKGLKMSFSSAMNRARVAHARRLIEDPNNQKVRLLTLGLDSGFGSKSSFNAEFQRLTGMTPSAYRKEKTTS